MRYSTMCKLALSAAGSALVLPSLANAQTTAPATPNAPDEIIVTAQRRSEALQDVPISISAASGKTLETRGVTRLEDIGLIAPGVQISRTGIYIQPSIRGITTALSGGENNVAIYVDGFYQSSSRTANLDLVNVAQVQVLKGPQGTLFGRNATGGAILVETLQPSLTATQAKFSGSYGKYNDKSVQGYVSVPIAQDKAGLSVVGSYRSSDGYIKDVSGFNSAPLKSANIGVKLLLRPSDALSITAGFDYAYLSDPRALSGTSDGHTLAKALFPTTYVETRDNMTSQTHPTVNYSNVYSGSLKVAYDVGPATLTSYTYYQDEHDFAHFEADDSTALSIYDQYFNDKSRTFTQEVNLGSHAGSRLQYVIGAFYYNNYGEHYNDFVQTLLNPANPTGYLPNSRYNNTAKAYAAYADVTYEIVPQLFVTGGLRYSHENKTQNVWNGAGVLQGHQAAGFDSTTPRAVVRYELSRKTNVYASFSKGFKSGAVNTVAPFTVIKPEKITAYEVGFKTVQGRFGFDAAAYHYDYKDLQVGTVTVVGTTVNTVTSNAATAKISGAEAQARFSLIDGLNISAGGAYTHARYGTFQNVPVTRVTAAGTNSTSCPNAAPPPATVTCTQDFSGRRMLRAPDWSGNIAVDYTVPLASGSLTLSGNVAYQSFSIPTKADFALDGSGGYRYGNPGYALVNLRAAYTLPDGKWKASVFGNNVFDKKYFIVHSGSVFGDYSVLGEPATYGVRVDYSF